MDNYRVTPEVGALMTACEKLFSQIITTGKLTTLDKEILEYYSTVLQTHLHGAGTETIQTNVLPEEPRLGPVASGLSRTVAKAAVPLGGSIYSLSLAYLHNFECF